MFTALRFSKTTIFVAVFTRMYRGTLEQIFSIQCQFCSRLAHSGDNVGPDPALDGTASKPLHQGLCHMFCGGLKTGWRAGFDLVSQRRSLAKRDRGSAR